MGQSLAPARISASWARSETYGAPTEAVDPAFTGAVDDGSLFARCGGEVLAGLHALLSRYLDEGQGFTARRMVQSDAFAGNYDQLARFGEWDITDDPDPSEVGQ